MRFTLVGQAKVKAYKSFTFQLVEHFHVVTFKLKRNTSELEDHHKCQNRRRLTILKLTCLSFKQWSDFEWFVYPNLE